MSPCIWLIGGTSESGAIAHHLSNQNCSYIVTVTTESAKQLYPDSAQVRVGPLDDKTVCAFITQWQVVGILDASHPFAAEISRLAIAQSKRSGIAYLRYERPITTPQPASDQIRFSASLRELLSSPQLQHQRVLFSLGYRALLAVSAQLSALRQTSQLFIRVLPSIKALSGALTAGFSSKEIMALRPPISPELEAALWQQWQISCVVAKASGRPGGEAVKHQIAKQLGVTLVLIQRPDVSYPTQTDSIPVAVEFCMEVLAR
ncbi:MAG: cobalt-precorrin-6A reductase [Cyanobacteria bacterium J06627_28]